MQMQRRRRRRQQLRQSQPSLFASLGKLVGRARVASDESGSFACDQLMESPSLALKWLAAQRTLGGPTLERGDTFEWNDLPRATSRFI